MIHVKVTDERECIPKFAILLAAYNGIQWIEEQIQSILKQKDVEVYIFISIDPSSDGTQELCEKFASNDDRVKLLPYAGAFGGAAKNFFRLIKDVDFSEFNYVSFSDQDDLWRENKLISAHDKIIANNVDAYSSNVTAFWPDGREMLICKSQPQREWDFMFEAAGPGCTYTLKNELANEIKKIILLRWKDIQSVYLHDWFCYAYARANDYRWYIDKESTLFYRQHANNQVGINSGIKALLSRLNKVFSGYGLEQSRLIGNIVGLPENSFFKSWCRLGRFDKFKLAFKAGKCRRRFRDQIFFFLVCISLALKINK